MNREEFCQQHWGYYLVLEKDFLDTERYISFDFGDNFAYDSHDIKDYANSNAFSNEYVKQYQAICSEVDVILKSICRELGNKKARSMNAYSDTILKEWPNLPGQKVRLHTVELQPFQNWKPSPNPVSPDWWTPYNKVKHERITNFKKANLKNVANALAGLYILEQYFVRFIGKRDNTMDVPNDISKLFEMVDFKTVHTVIGRDFYMASDQEVDEMLDEVFGKEEPVGVR